MADKILELHRNLQLQNGYFASHRNCVHLASHFIKIIFVSCTGSACLAVSCTRKACFGLAVGCTGPYVLAD